MKPKPNKNLSLPWTPQGEKASGNHQILLPIAREKATSFPHKSSYRDPTFWLSCIDSLTSPTVLLWLIHHHCHKYLYQLSFTCEQKPIIKKKQQHIFERKMADFMIFDAFYTLVPRLPFRLILESKLRHLIRYACVPINVLVCHSDQLNGTLSWLWSRFSNAVKDWQKTDNFP